MLLLEDGELPVNTPSDDNYIGSRVESTPAVLIPGSVLEVLPNGLLVNLVPSQIVHLYGSKRLFIHLYLMGYCSVYL